MVLGFRVLVIVLFLGTYSCKNDNNLVKEIEQSEDINIKVDTVDKTYIDLYSTYDEMAAIRIEHRENREIAAVKSNGKWGLLNLFGDTIMPFNYNHFSSNEATFVLGNKGHQDYYNGAFEYLDSSTFDNIDVRFPKFYIARIGSKQVLLDSIGKEISTQEFDDIMVPRSGNYYIGKQGNKWKSYALNKSIDSLGYYMRIGTELMNTANVTLRGYGPFRLGMTFKEVNQIYDDIPLQVTFNEPYCKMASYGDNFPTFLLLFEESKGKLTLERIYINDPAIKTKSGIGIGDSKSKLIAAYGDKIKSEQHKYDEKGAYLYFVPVDKADTDYRINFNYDGHKIDGYSLGRMPAVMYVEGCL